MTHEPGHRRGEYGSTLVEVMIAVLVLLTIAMAGGAFLLHSRSQLSIQRNKRIMLEECNRRLETIRATGYSAITNLLPRNTSTHYLRIEDGDVDYSASDPGETVRIPPAGGIQYPVTTTVQFMDVDGGTVSLDYLFIRVQGNYLVNSTDAVTLETNFGP